MSDQKCWHPASSFHHIADCAITGDYSKCLKDAEHPYLFSMNAANGHLKKSVPLDYVPAGTISPDGAVQKSSGCGKYQYRSPFGVTKSDGKYPHEDISSYYY